MKMDIMTIIQMNVQEAVMPLRTWKITLCQYMINSKKSKNFQMMKTGSMANVAVLTIATYSKIYARYI